MGPRGGLRSPWADILRDHVSHVIHQILHRTFNVSAYSLSKPVDNGICATGLSHLEFLPPHSTVIPLSSPHPTPPWPSEACQTRCSPPIPLDDATMRPDVKVNTPRSKERCLSNAPVLDRLPESGYTPIFATWYRFDYGTLVSTRS